MKIIYLDVIKLILGLLDVQTISELLVVKSQSP